MAIIHKTGDVFTTEQPAIGHGCNTKGAFGAGVALAVRQKYPEVYPPYSAACRFNFFTPGSVLPIKGHDGRWILNMATQIKPGRDARLDLIRDALINAVDFCLEMDMKGLAIPRIGAGIGGLKWEDVLQTTQEVMSADEYKGFTLEVWTL